MHAASVKNILWLFAIYVNEGVTKSLAEIGLSSSKTVYAIFYDIYERPCGANITSSLYLFMKWSTSIPARHIVWLWLLLPIIVRNYIFAFLTIRAYIKAL